MSTSGQTCGFTTGYQLPSCPLGQSGIQRIYLAPLDKNWAQTGITFNADLVITGMTSGVTFYAFDLTQETGGFNTVIPTNVQNSSQFYESTIELVIANANPLLRNQIRAIVAGPTMAIVETRANYDGLPGVSPLDGDLRFVGATLGCWNLPATKADTGKASGDFRGYNIQLQAKEPVEPYFIQDKSVFTWSY